jgi:hypothetical protein
MAELDQIRVINPKDEPFEVRKNGELYTLPANFDGQYPQHLARHIAKYLSDKLINEEVVKLRKSFEKKKEELPGIREIQMTMYDNPMRRMFLYDILRDKTEVERTIKSYPQFKSQDGKENFIGDITEYDDYVNNLEAKEAPVVEEVEETTSEPKAKATKGKK